MPFRVFQVLLAIFFRGNQIFYNSNSEFELNPFEYDHYVQFKFKINFHQAKADSINYFTKANLPFVLLVIQSFPRRS